MNVIQLGLISATHVKPDSPIETMLTRWWNVVL